MRNRAGIRLLLAIVGLGGVALMAAADDLPRSHVPIPPRSGTSDPEQLFRERFEKAELFRDLRQQLEKSTGKNIEELLNILKDANIKPDSPQFARLVQQELERQARGGSDLKLNPEQMETLQRLFKGLFPEGIPLLPDKDPITGRPPISPVEPPDLTPQGGKQPDRDPKTGDAKRTPDWVKTPEDQAALEEASRQMAQFASRLDGWSDKVRGSPALRRALGDLSRLALENSNGGTSGLDGALARWNRFAKQGQWFNKNWGRVRGLDMPKLPSLGLSKIRLGGMSGPSFGAAGGVGVPGTGSGWPWLLGLVGILAAVVALWKVLSRYASRGMSTVEDGWELGPWPVPPAAVATRADLVRTFEYLSLLLLGRPARNWNHRDIAARIGGDEAGRRQAANQLAGWYEQARYAPEDEPLPDRAVADFRRDLCLLAGVPSA